MPSLPDCSLCSTSPVKCKSLCMLTTWADGDDLKTQMIRKELRYIHDKSYLLQNPQVQPKMRSILMNWLFQASSMFNFQRETTYLAQDYFDRFLMTQKDVDKESLHLYAATALLIAAKKEEIYPPKIVMFAGMTWGACDIWEIQHTEIIMLKALNWNLSPETPIAWLNLYIQIDAEQQEEWLLEPHFNQEKYVQITQLLDLCIMDIESLDFTYRVLAAAALVHFSDYETVYSITDLTWDVLGCCYWWMFSFMGVLGIDTKPRLYDFEGVQPNLRHNIQTIDVNEEMLARAQAVKNPFGSGPYPTPPATDDLLLDVDLDMIIDLSDD